MSRDAKRLPAAIPVHHDLEEPTTADRVNTDDTTCFVELVQSPLLKGKENLDDYRTASWLSEPDPVQIHVDDKTPQSAEEAASLLSQSLFSWVFGLMRKGSKQQLNQDDLWPLSKCDKVSVLLPAYEKARAAGYSLLGALAKISSRTMFQAGIAMLLYTLSQLAAPILIYLLIDRLQSDGNGSLYVCFGILIATAISALCNHIHLHLAFRVGQQLRSLVIAIVYRKALELNTVARSAVTTGQIINLMSNDSQKLFDLLPQIHLLWAGPLQIILASYLLVRTLGVSALAGIASLIVLVPINMILAKMYQRVREKHVPVMDQRVKLCSELLQSIRVVKYYNWEEKFIEKIMAIRKIEISYVKKEMLMWAITVVLVVICPVFAMFFSFMAYCLLGNVLTAADAFSSAVLFTVLRFPLMALGNVVTSAIQAQVSMDRVSRFLERENPANGGSYQRTLSASNVSADTPLISIKECELTWLDEATATHAESESFSLTNLSLEVRRRELVAVVGRVGAGKSTLISSILGETFIKAGNIEATGTIAYANQEPWILNATLRENVTFGRPWNEVLYRQVLDACQLWADLRMLPDGDRTFIGEKGVTLSGGQKARVSLARAAYSQPDILLLDDPLSALDSHTGRKVFDSLLGSNGFMSNTARILVTHAHQYLSRADRVVVMHAGKMLFEGHYSALAGLSTKRAEGDGSTEVDEVSQLVLATFTEAMQEGGEEDEEHENQEEEVVAVQGELADRDGALNVEEERDVGAKGWKIFKLYLKAAGGYRWGFVVLVILCIERLIYVALDWWLSVWTSAAKGPVDSMLGEFRAVESQEDTNFYLTVYAIIVGVSAFAIFVRASTFPIVSTLAAKTLFERLLVAVFRSPMRFFETTPTGRIVNRISYDTEMNDVVLVLKMKDVVTSLFWMITGMIVMVAVVPLMGAVLIPVAITYVVVQRFYQKSSVELQRLDAVSRSPIQAHFAESLQGTSTIRAFDSIGRFVFRSDFLIDENNRALFAFNSCARWLGVRLELIGALVIFMTSLFCWLARDSVGGGLTGLAVLWAYNYTISLNFFVLFSAETEAKLTSVERVLEYGDLPSEAPLHIPENKPVADWPQKGRLEFRNVYVKYRPELDPALRGLTFTVEAGQRVGVVGRTGAGKSSLATAIFRLCELWEGEIVVDDVNLGTLGLSDVRGRGICIIPQDPAMFSGTVRSNLDPLDRFEDHDIWQSLERVRMDETIRGLAGGLYAEVSENASNLSLGQRQLLCLARALLCHPKILVLDEATASVDPDTDNFIQKTVREVFHSTTLLTIAHRLNTIMDYDKVLVMQEGKAAEYETPAKLLENPNSLFSQLVASAGEDAAAKLRTMVAH